MISYSLVILAAALPLVYGHAGIFHPSMWGFNVTGKTFPYDNRPVAPLADMTFQEWWFHNHLAFPPHPGDFFDLPAGQRATAELACDKGATSYFASNPGGDIRKSADSNDPCPGSPTKAFHANDIENTRGCALAITYKSDVNSVQPEDFAVFSINHTCVWNRFTDFAVPAKMPACPPGGCICAFFWIHAEDSGSEQNYMNGFRCQVNGATSVVPVAKSKVPRRCGADPKRGKMEAVPSNCTYGAKTPFYWFQKERNNMFEGPFAPPFYNDLYNFKEGAQDDIFEDSQLPFSDGTLNPSSATISRPDSAESTTAAVSSPSPTPSGMSSGLLGPIDNHPDIPDIPKIGNNGITNKKW